MDEFDGSDPSAGVILNEALANGKCTFPNSPMTREAHPDFRVIAAGNTLGNSRDLIYTGRNALDGATLNRFQNIPINYDRKLELSLINGDEALADFAEGVRKKGKEYGIICSYRNTMNVKKWLGMEFSLKDAMGFAFANAIELDKALYLRNALRSTLSGNVYFEAFEAIVNEKEMEAA